MKELLSLEAELISGLIPERPYSSNTLWLSGSNVISAEQGLRPTYPQGNFGAKTHNDAIHSILVSDIGDGVAKIYTASASTISEWIVNGGRSNISRVGGYGSNLRSDLWSMVEFNDRIYATNGKYIQEFETGNPNMVDYSTVSDYASVFTSAEVVSKLKQHLIFLNLDLDDRSFAWSNANDASSVVPTASNSAGFDRIRNLDSAIITAVPLGQGLAVYSKNEVYLLSYIGSPLVFRTDRLAKGIGPINKNCVVEVEGVHYGIGENGIWVFDGNSFNYIDAAIKKQSLICNCNEDYSHTAFCWHSSKENMVVFSWPGGKSSEPDTTWGFNYREGGWWNLGYKRTAGLAPGILNYGITGDAEGNIYRQFEPGTAEDDGNFSGSNDPSDIYSTTMLVRAFGQGGFGSGGFGDVIIIG